MNLPNALSNRYWVSMMEKRLQAVAGQAEIHIRYDSQRLHWLRCKQKSLPG